MASVSSSSSGDSSIPTRTLEQVDNEFTCTACLGHGAFSSSVFLAKKTRSGRKVALKIIPLATDSSSSNDTDADDDNSAAYESFIRELDAVKRLKKDKSGSNRDMGIIYFEESFITATTDSPNNKFACIVMQYVNGGTLAQAIASKLQTTQQPYTERRIAWYALQLSEALAFAHENGVHHFDVKSTNVLVDLGSGGKLLLADFGNAVTATNADTTNRQTGATTMTISGFSELYASPELHAAHARGDYSGLEAQKVDSFGLGCILFELVCCQKLVDLTQEQTLGEFIQHQGVDAALNSPFLKLPWCAKRDCTALVAVNNGQQVGYSDALRNLVKLLLQALPSNRWAPSQLQEPLRHDRLSPLMANFVVAAQTAVPGAQLSVDNVQLGMFVQRGNDWNEGDADGGQGSIGIVVALDADAGFCSVAWPLILTPTSSADPMCCRIGASNKFELKIGPAPLADFYHETTEPRVSGIVQTCNASKYTVGQLINSNCIVVGMRNDQNLLFVAPMGRMFSPSLKVTPIGPPSVALLSTRKPQKPPGNWQRDAGLLVEVTDLQERGTVLDLFHSVEGGMDIQACEVTSLRRVESVDLWTAYSQTREGIATENWGVYHEQRLFHGTFGASADALLRKPSEFFQNCSGGGDFYSREISFSKLPSNAAKNGYRGNAGTIQIVLSRVALGRPSLSKGNSSSHLNYHSEGKQDPSNQVFTIRNPTQAFPEYVITYKQVPVPVPNRRIVAARRPGQGGRGSTRPPSGGGQGRQRPRAHSADAPASRRPITAPPPTVAAPVAKPVVKTSSVPSPTKMCVVCLERPVSRILIPCGHPCLCQVCSTAQGLKKLRRKCPECRQAIKDAVVFYGRIVND